MTIKAKIKEQFSVSAANFTSAIINGFFWLYLASTLEKTEYGEISFYISIAEIGFSLANFGLAGAITVLGAKGEKIFFPAYEFGLISSTVLASIIFLLTNNLPVSLLVIGSMIWTLLQAEFNSKKQYSKWSLFHLVRRIITVIASLVLIQFLGIEGIIWGFIIGITPSLIGIKKFLESSRTNFDILKSKISFLAGIYFSGLSTNLFWWGDKTIIGSVYGLTILADYQLASQFFGLLYTIPLSLSIFLIPQESQGIKNKKIKIISLIIIFGITIVSIIILPTVVENYFKEYVETILVAQIMLLGIIPAAISNIVESSFLGKEKSNMVLVTNSIQIGVYLILIILLGGIFGIIGFAMGFLIAIISRTVANVIIWKKLILTHVE